MLDITTFTLLVNTWLFRDIDFFLLISYLYDIIFLSYIYILKKEIKNESTIMFYCVFFSLSHSLFYSHMI